MARPSLYDPAYCERVIELGEQGASIAEMAYELGVVKNTLENWAAEHEEFLNAFTRAKLASQVWWERKGRAGMEKSSSEFQASVWSRSMAARFPEDWREVKGTELTGKDGGPIAVAPEAAEWTVIDTPTPDGA
jgi:transposase-like protein